MKKKIKQIIAGALTLGILATSPLYGSKTSEETVDNNSTPEYTSKTVDDVYKKTTNEFNLKSLLSDTLGLKFNNLFANDNNIFLNDNYLQKNISDTINSQGLNDIFGTNNNNGLSNSSIAFSHGAPFNNYGSTNTYTSLYNFTDNFSLYILIGAKTHPNLPVKDIYGFINLGGRFGSKK